MAIPEACGLWIEQRIEEELQQKKDTGASLREIGRQVAAEVERYFETKVNPRTIEKRAERSATNVAHTENPTTTRDSEEIKQIKRQPAKDGTMRGGPRPGAGRKMKSNDGQPVRICAYSEIMWTIPLQKRFYALSGHKLTADPPLVSWRMSVKGRLRQTLFG